MLEANGIGDVPAIHAEALLGPVDTIGLDDLVEPRIGCGERLVLSQGPILEVVRTAEVVFGAGAADRGIVGVAVQEELDLTFTPPPRVVDAPSQIGANKVTLTLNAFEDGVDALVGERVDATKLRVEVGAVLGRP